MAGLAVMAALVFVNVVLRYAFNSGIALSDEVARFLFVWLTFLGAIAAYGRGEHIRTEFLRARLSPRWRRALDVASELVVAGCCVLLLVGAGKLFMQNLTNRAPISGLPTAAVYASGLVAGVVILLLSAVRLTALVTGSEDSPGIAASKAAAAKPE